METQNPKSSRPLYSVLAGVICFALLSAAYYFLTGAHTSSQTNSSQIPDKIPESVEAIDLGLSVKWAICNLGATLPEEYGSYYAWGDIKEYHNGGNPNFQIGVGESICGTKYDAAHIKWGGKWRMPSMEEASELLEKCTWKETSYKGVKGNLVTGPNGNAIFLPFAGSKSNSEIVDMGGNGMYWTGLGDEEFEQNDAAHCIFSGVAPMLGREVRNMGLSIRPVLE